MSWKEDLKLEAVMRTAEWAKRNPWKSLGLALAFTAIVGIGYLIT